MLVSRCFALWPYTEEKFGFDVAEMILIKASHLLQTKYPQNTFSLHEVSHTHIYQMYMSLIQDWITKQSSQIPRRLYHRDHHCTAMAVDMADIPVNHPTLHLLSLLLLPQSQVHL